MKIKLVDLGMQCEKKEINFRDLGMSRSSANEMYGYNTRVSENEKSVLVIESQNLENSISKFANKLWENRHRNIHEIDHADLAEYLSQNAKSFVRIES